MNEMTLKKTIADNLIYYRRKNGLTQAALAQTLNYSDKSVSKWERAEGMPDVTVLMMLAELYGITINELVTERSETQPLEEATASEQSEEVPAVKPRSLRARILVPVLSIGLAWLTAVFVYFLIMVISPSFEYGALIFLYAVPASFIIATVFACLWWSYPLRFVTVSGIIWSVALSLDLTFKLPSIHLIFIVAGVLQVLTVLWFILMKK